MRTTRRDPTRPHTHGCIPYRLNVRRPKFSSLLYFVGRNFRHLAKISSLGQNFVTWPKFRHLAKISSLGQNFVTWPKFRHLAKISSLSADEPLADKVHLYKQNENSSKSAKDSIPVTHCHLLLERKHTHLKYKM